MVAHVSSCVVFRSIVVLHSLRRNGPQKIRLFDFQLFSGHESRSTRIMSNGNGLPAATNVPISVVYTFLFRVTIEVTYAKGVHAVAPFIDRYHCFVRVCVYWSDERLMHVWKMLRNGPSCFSRNPVLLSHIIVALGVCLYASLRAVRCIIHQASCHATLYAINAHSLVFHCLNLPVTVFPVYLLENGVENNKIRNLKVSKFLQLIFTLIL